MALAVRLRLHEGKTRIWNPAGKTCLGRTLADRQSLAVAGRWSAVAEFLVFAASLLLLPLHGAEHRCGRMCASRLRLGKPPPRLVKATTPVCPRQYTPVSTNRIFFPRTLLHSRVPDECPCATADHRAAQDLTESQPAMARNSCSLGSGRAETRGGASGEAANARWAVTARRPKRQLHGGVPERAGAARFHCQTCSGPQSLRLPGGSAGRGQAQGVCCGVCGAMARRKLVYGAARLNVGVRCASC